MIRSSCHSLKFVNQAKLNKISSLVESYRSMVAKYINVLWAGDPLSHPTKLLSSTICNSIKADGTSARLRQAAAKQACSMVEAACAKQRKRLYVLRKFQAEGKDTKHLQRKIDTDKIIKPKANDVNIELDSRFVDVQESNGHFDVFVHLESLGNGFQFNLPLKHTKVSRKWLSEGKLKPSIRLTTNAVFLFFDVPEPVKQSGRILGADQGIATCLTLSDGQATFKNKDGYDLSSIMMILARKRKGSRGFQRASDHRKNYINWALKQLDFNGVREVRLEKIKNLRRGVRTDRFRSGWTYTLIKRKLVSLGEEKGFQVIEQASSFRSQRCSRCGWTHKLNRKGKTFKCQRCSFITDADLNAASNHEAELVDLGQQAWRNAELKSGFYWKSLTCGQELIVPGVLKTQAVNSC